MITVSELRASYGTTQVLAGVSLELRDRQIVTLFGRNGVGKTTFMRTLMGLIRPTHGSVIVDGQDVAGMRPHGVARSGVAYVPQGRGIFPKLSVYENMLIGTRARNDNTHDIPDDVLEMFPWLPERFKQIGGTLSGGQQQMLALARAMCGRPRYLLLDEPSEGIQPSIVQQIEGIIADLREKSGLSVLIVEQNIDLGLALADYCFIMEKGSIAYQATPEKLQDQDLLRRYLAI